MGETKRKLAAGEVARGGWVMVGHPTVAELFAGEGFDWICIDLEHTPIDYQTFEHMARAVKPSGCDLLARLQACDPVQAKRVPDAGADGIIVPMVNDRELAELAVASAKFPPAGIRGASFSRASDFGRNFRPYFDQHNDKVIVVVMIEHADAVRNLDAILTTPGIDATLIGPYDLSCSLGRPGELQHPEVKAAVQTILDGCLKHNVPAGIHVVATSAEAVADAAARGFRFIGCGLDTAFLVEGCRRVLGGSEER
ncbi:MAG: 2,4-dihydroxyhept-2-ene-1,7-dioic acid aldolase [Armatimonadetes bacterium]|nr:2,4-dihydroxyhept-2-ene-1,7-dioic acid aldolase [Armatimonadota bacterium]